mmetsp:Transcript_21870/g.51372  ORF Transcript_21870/g.51372 Transcript_21870/m.51372 type:complete len:288 (+) Transcript_21870:1035-1898(+)
MQGLVGKGRQLQPGGGSAAGRSGGSTAAMRLGGRALKTSAQSGGAPRSRMKMLDDSEGFNLAKQQQDDSRTLPGRAKKLTGLKRKAAPSAGKAAKAVKLGRSNNSAKTKAAEPSRAAPTANHQHTEEEQLETSTVGAVASPSEDRAKFAQQQQPQQTAAATDNQQAALAAAALSKYQTQMRGAGVSQQTHQQEADPIQGQAPRQLNWQQLLREKSNKLTPQDKLRIQHFFETRTNPTPDQQLVYKMKLHEERGTDARTGKQVKETYYLELNYQNFTSKQSKKVKRYD